MDSSLPPLPKHLRKDIKKPPNPSGRRKKFPVLSKVRENNELEKPLDIPEIAIVEEATKKASEIDTKTAISKAVVESDVLNYADTVFADSLRKKKIGWQPFPGVQTEFLEADEDEVLFAGGRGSGKSMCLLVDAVRHVGNKNFRALIIRRTMPELKELIKRAKDLYYLAFPGVKWKEQDKMFLFPSGATIEFGYCDAVDDVERYRGQQYTWLGIDEVTQFETDEAYMKLKGSLRTTDPELKIYIRLTTNPTGKGRNWVKEYFIDEGEAGKRITKEIETPFGKMQLTKKWFQSTIKDNPAILENNPTYVAQLAALPPVLRKQWLEGSWEAIEGMAFPEFDTDIHVIQPFPIPKPWLKFRGADWGFGSEACCLWLAVDYDNNIYVYREFACNGKLAVKRGEERYTADKFAIEVLKRERDEQVRYGVLDISTWNKKGDSGPSIAEEMEMQGCFWRQSDRTGNSRKSAKMIMHKLLELNPETKKPRIFVFNTCKELIRCLTSLSVDDNDPEDVDTDGYDHPWDALMYAIMSRPTIANAWDDWARKSYNDRPIVIDSTFGY